jgi:Na+-transporting methylmalonyl-CoA/oxaloacetate decarboxylase gamma subunit
MARNGNLIVGCLVLLLLAALIVTGIVFGIKALVNRGGDEPAPEESGDMQEENPAAAKETAVPVIDASLASADAFALGNDAYEAGDYPLAEAYYRHAVDSDVSSALYRNNLAWPCCSRK